MSERTIFLAALEREDPAERAAYLDAACAGDPALRRQVESLLQAHAAVGASQFLNEPAAEQLAAAIPSGAGPTHPAEDARAPGAGGEATQAGEKSAADDDTLAFLQPPHKPGALGRLAHYEVLEVLGKGGMGVVLKAFDEKLHRVVAIKVLGPQLAASATARKRFLREARAAAAIRNEHVIDIHAVDDSPVPYLVMECVDGQTLQAKLDKTGPLGLRETLRIGYQVACGLAAAHTQGLVHRDIKPANILLENGVERVKITDFGLARASDDASLSQSGVVAGTPMYMSPEQAEGQTVDHRSDLFSLGSVLYALCTGRAPFRASTTMAVLKRVCEDTPRPIREVNAEVPDWLCDLIGRLHAKRPADRFQSAGEVAALLGQHLARLQQPSLAPDTRPNAGRASPATAEETRKSHAPSARKRGWLFAVALLGLLAALGLTEVVGVTHVTRAVVRLLRPEGPPVVEETREPAPAGDRPAMSERPGFPPLDPAWRKRVADLPPEKQAEAVAQELQRRNPGFDGRWAEPPTIYDGAVGRLGIHSDQVRDLTPLQALPRLRTLYVVDPKDTHQPLGALEDLRPLKGLPLVELRLYDVQVADLSPVRDLASLRSLDLRHLKAIDLTQLQGLPLIELEIHGGVTDLSPLRGMKELRSLLIISTAVTDLKPLEGLPLERLSLHATGVEDLSPLRGMPLKDLNLHRTPVKDLSPLKGMKLEKINYWETPIQDISVLKGMPLRELNCDFQRERDEAVLRSIETLAIINGKPAAEFWKTVEPRP
jgi:serine/threonine protein kinase